MATTDDPQYEFRIPDTGTEMQQHTQHGMRQPDGTIVWARIRHNLRNGSQRTVDFHRMDPSNSSYNETQIADWGAILQDRATYANLPVDEYAKGYQLVKRSVVLAATDAEDVK